MSMAVHGLATCMDAAPLKERLPARALRQMDRFTRLALLCLLRTLDDANLTDKDLDPAATGIVVATGYGPASPTFAFLDSILAHGDILASPLSFSHSVHNIPAASLALHFGLTGPCTTCCQIDNPVAAALLTAQLWLDEGRADRVFLGAVDEHTPLLETVSRDLADTRGGKGLRADLPVRNGAAFFCLGPDFCPDSVSPYRGWIDGIAIRREDARRASWHDRRPDEPIFLSGSVPPEEAERPGAAHLGSVYGNIPVAQAFDMAVALSDTTGVPGGRALCLGYGRRDAGFREIASVRVRQASACQGGAS